MRAGGCIARARLFARAPPSRTTHTTPSRTSNAPRGRDAVRAHVRRLGRLRLGVGVLLKPDVGMVLRVGALRLGGDAALLEREAVRLDERALRLLRLGRRRVHPLLHHCWAVRRERRRRSERARGGSQRRNDISCACRAAVSNPKDESSQRCSPRARTPHPRRQDGRAGPVDPEEVRRRRRAGACGVAAPQQSSQSPPSARFRCVRSPLTVARVLRVLHTTLAVRVTALRQRVRRRAHPVGFDASGARVANTVRFHFVRARATRFQRASQHGWDRT